MDSCFHEFASEHRGKAKQLALKLISETVEHKGSLSDKTKLEMLFKNFGIDYINEENVIICNEGYDGVQGYSSFYTKFYFIKEKFSYMGAYE